MKKLFGLLLFAGILFSSCDTSEDPVEEVKPTVFKFMVDGVEKDFSSNVIVSFSDNLFGTTTIVATDGDESVELELFDNTLGVTEKPQGELGLNSIIFQSGDYKFISGFLDTEYNFDISIFQGEGDIIKGKFSATLKHMDMPEEGNIGIFGTDTLAVITNGEFYVTK